jgi:hypothetical protein
VRIAFIIHRYGTEILGGPEYACRLLAEELAERHDVDVITTCARDPITWKNEYPEGTDRVRGVTVRRFASSHVRDIADFDRYSEWIFENPHDTADEMEWLKRQGPWAPGLLDYLKRQHKQYEALVFVTYRHAPTVLGIQIDPARSILMPAAHDEPAVHLGIFRDVFRLPKAIGYLSEPERRFVVQHFERTAAIEETVGCGVEIPPHQAYPRQLACRPRATSQPAANPSAFHRTSPRAGRDFGAGIAFTARSPSMAAASIQAKAAKSSSNTSAPTRPAAATPRWC